ncbi:putative high-glucose-regulated protein [Handroanthus impetiginosus]|uniref:YTH domain-containing family protein n=1 Tax=Handroanthus impetiginosus TaxID=429701 RepID=A0A2G9H8V1_9LAMI|nr:putative high-glucose-regulated protein [Handroanthus impetiginosus]
MEEANQRGLDRFASVPSSGERAVEPHNMTEQPVSPKDERIVSANPSPDAAISGALRNAKEQPSTSETSGAFTTMHPFNSYTPQDQSYYFGGYNNGSGSWDERSNYVNSNNLHAMPQAMYSDNSSLFFPPGYGYDSQMAYGQLSPLAGPLSPLMFDGQLFSPHQMPVPQPYYPPPVSPGPPHVTSGLPASQTELLTSGSSSQENLIDNSFFGPGSGYYLPFGSFGGGDLSGSSNLGVYKFPGEFGSNEPLPSRSSSLDTGNFVSPLTSGNAYPQQFGILGSYEQNVAQGFGPTSNSSARHFVHGGSYQSPVGYSSNRIRFGTDKGGRRERDRDTFSMSTDTLVMPNERNRGPRALKPKSKNTPEEGSLSHIRDVESTSGFRINSPEFVTGYEHAKFFVIKSFSEDNIHKSIKYNVWASTPLGNKKLDAAYREAMEAGGICPVFLFFSVNASGQFCGVAEMVGPVDFENDADYWQQDRWSGQFPIKWHIIKDVPNSCFRHILLENNDNKPVTHSRDSQEVKLEQGIEMLKIFKGHDAETSLLDDFDFYDEREKSLMERKAKQRSNTTGNPTAALAKDSIDQLSGNLADALRLDGGKSLSKSDLV